VAYAETRIYRVSTPTPFCSSGSCRYLARHRLLKTLSGLSALSVSPEIPLVSQSLEPTGGAGRRRLVAGGEAVRTALHTTDEQPRPFAEDSSGPPEAPDSLNETEAPFFKPDRCHDLVSDCLQKVAGAVAGRLAWLPDVPTHHRSGHSYQRHNTHS
jgi:hypothetical protein